MRDIDEITLHLRAKKVYKDEYIDRVEEFMKRNPDLASEFASCIPKNTILDHYIEVKGYSLKRLGATTMLSRSAIYVSLARMREEDADPEVILKEEEAYFRSMRK